MDIKSSNKTSPIQQKIKHKEQLDTQKILVAKTLLAGWKHMQGYEELSTQLVEKAAHLSFHSTMATELIVNRLIDRMYKKQTIASLRNKIQELVSDLKPSYSQTLESYFLKGTGASALSEIMGTRRRTIYTRINSGIEEIAKRLEEVGINMLTWNHLISQYKWLRNEYNAQSTEL